MLFDVEMMSQADYSVYMSGGNDYICATVTVEADSPESAAEQVAKRYPFMLVHKEYVKPSKKTSPDWVNSNYACNCSACGGEAMHREFRWLEKGIYPICPNCGAGMMRG